MEKNFQGEVIGEGFEGKSGNVFRKKYQRRVLTKKHWEVRNQKIARVGETAKESYLSSKSSEKFMLVLRFSERSWPIKVCSFGPIQHQLPPGRKNKTDHT